MKNLLRGLGLLACAAVLLYSGSLLVPYLINSFREQRAYAELSDEVRKAYAEAIPLRRLGTAQDIAEAVAFLASPGASYITGQILGVNGGMYC